MYSTIEKRAQKFKTPLLIIFCVVLLIFTVTTVILINNRIKAATPKARNTEKAYRPQVLETVTLFGEVVPINPDVPASEFSIKHFTVNENGVVTYLGDNAAYGVDVSTFQNDIDWQEVKESGVDFAIIRLGFRGMSKGGLFLDDYFHTNINGATDADIDVGVYFFSQAISVEEAREEAEYVLEVLDGTELQYPIFFDWEPGYDTVDRTNSIYSSPVINDFALEFCRVIKEAGYRAGIYFNSFQGYHQYDLSLFEDTFFWIAEYDTQSDFYYAFNMWQYSCTADVNGIPSPVDFNICFTMDNLN